MTKLIAKLILVGGLCAGALLGTSEARAWTAVVVHPTVNTWGALATDTFISSVSARARKASAPQRGQLNVTAVSAGGSYTSSLTIWCTGGTSNLDKFGTNTIDGDITLNCPGGSITNAGGALQAF